MLCGACNKEYYGEFSRNSVAMDLLAKDILDRYPDILKDRIAILEDLINERLAAGVDECDLWYERELQNRYSRQIDMLVFTLTSEDTLMYESFQKDFCWFFRRLSEVYTDITCSFLANALSEIEF